MSVEAVHANAAAAEPGRPQHLHVLQQAALDAFEMLSLGPSGPTMPGQPADGGANAAGFPRPAGPAAQVDSQVGPPAPYSPFNCKPEFVRMTSFAVPNSQVRCCCCNSGAPELANCLGGRSDDSRSTQGLQAAVGCQPRASMSPAWAARQVAARRRAAPQALKARWHLPYGAVVHPMALAGGPVPVANPAGSTIIRCKRCRTYMNPFMAWMDGGRSGGALGQASI